MRARISSARHQIRAVAHTSIMYKQTLPITADGIDTCGQRASARAPNTSKQMIHKQVLFVNRNRYV